MLPRYAALLSLASAASAYTPRGCGTPPSPTSSTSTTSTTEVISSYPDSCTYRPTQTYYSSSGCAFNCSTGFCIIDAPATVSCGCPTVFIETQTVTICPTATATPCYQCHTGWGTFIYTETCSTSTGGGAVPTAS